jgi:hypothetical protein
MGFVGYKQYERALIDYVDLFVEGFYQLMAALAALGGGTLSREDYDKDFGDEMREGLYASPLGVFFNRARWAGFSAAGLGLVGTAVAYLLPGPAFPVISTFSLLPAVFVLAQAMLASGMFVDSLDPNDPDRDEINEINPGYDEAFNYMLYGSLGALAVEAYVIGMSIMSMDAVPTKPITEVVGTTESENTDESLNGF